MSSSARRANFASCVGFGALGLAVMLLAPTAATGALGPTGNRDTADRTNITIYARIVEVDKDIASSLHLDSMQLDRLAEKLVELEKRGELRVVARAKVTTRNRWPKRLSVPIDRSTTFTLEVFPRLTDPTNVNLQILVETRVRRPGSDEEDALDYVSSQASTTVTIRSGETIVLSGAIASANGTPAKATLTLVSVECQRPSGPDAATSLTPTEIRDRRLAQLRYLQDGLVRKFPDADVRLVPTDDKIAIEGTLQDDDLRSPILTHVLRRAVRLEIVSGSLRNLPELMTSPASPIIDRLYVSQIVARVVIGELDAAAADKIDPKTLSQAGADLLAPPSGTKQGRHFRFIRIPAADGGNGPSIMADIHRLQQDRVMRTSARPTIRTMSGQICTCMVGNRVDLPHINPDDHLCYGTELTILPTVLDDGRIRFSVTARFDELAEDRHNADPPQVVLTSRKVAGVCLVSPNETLALVESPGKADGESKDVRQVVFITPEVVQPVDDDAATARADTVQR